MKLPKLSTPSQHISQCSHLDHIDQKNSVLKGILTPPACPLFLQVQEDSRKMASEKQKGILLPFFFFYLYNGCTNAAIEPNPVDGGNDSIARHGAEDDGAQSVPLLCEVTGVDLSKKHCQDHGQHSDQIHLAPVLRAKRNKGKVVGLLSHAKVSSGQEISVTEHSDISNLSLLQAPAVGLSALPCVCQLALRGRDSVAQEHLAPHPSFQALPAPNAFSAPVPHQPSSAPRQPYPQQALEGNSFTHPLLDGEKISSYLVGNAV